MFQTSRKEEDVSALNLCIFFLHFPSLSGNFYDAFPAEVCDLLRGIVEDGGENLARMFSQSRRAGESSDGSFLHLQRIANGFNLLSIRPVKFNDHFPGQDLRIGEDPVQGIDGTRGHARF